MNKKILIGAGITAAIVAPAVAIICDRRAKAKLGELPKEKIYSIEELKKEPLTYLPLLIPTAIGIGALVGMNKKFGVAVAAGYVASRGYAHRYRDLMDKVEDFAPKKAKEFRKKLLEDKRLTNDYIEGDEDEIIAYEMFSGRMFYTTEKKVLDAEDTIDRFLMEHDDASLNDFYDCLGIERSIFGSQWGLNIYKPITEAGWKNTFIEVEEGKDVLFIEGPKWELLF